MMYDDVGRPAHYCAGRRYEPIDVIEDWGLGFNLGNAVKYISRAGRKGDGAKDLRKAVWYLQREVRRIETCDETPPWEKGLKEDLKDFGKRKDESFDERMAIVPLGFADVARYMRDIPVVDEVHVWYSVRNYERAVRNFMKEDMHGYAVDRGADITSFQDMSLKERWSYLSDQVEGIADWFDIHRVDTMWDMVLTDFVYMRMDEGTLYDIIGPNGMEALYRRMDA